MPTYSGNWGSGNTITDGFPTLRNVYKITTSGSAYGHNHGSGSVNIRIRAYNPINGVWYTVWNVTTSGQVSTGGRTFNVSLPAVSQLQLYSSPGQNSTFHGTTYYTIYYNNGESETIGVSFNPSSVHRENTTISGTVQSTDDSNVRYKISVNGVERIPLTGYFASPKSISHVIDNSWLNIGSNTVSVYSECTTEGSGNGKTANFTLNKVNSNPSSILNLVPSSFHKDDVAISGTVSDANIDDLVAYRVLINNVVIQDWSQLLDPPYDWSITVDHTKFNVGSNTVKVEVKDDFSGVVYSTSKSITKTNAVPTVEAVFQKSPVHLESANLNMTVNDLESDMVQYRVLLNGVEKASWSPLMEVPFQASLAFLNIELNEGSNTVQVQLNDDLNGKNNVNFTIEKVNTLPTVEGYKVDGNIVKGTITDADGDMVKFKILLNDVQVYPEADYTNYQTTPFNLHIPLPMEKVNLGENNVVKVEMVDLFGATTYIVGNYVIDYVGLMFHDEFGDYYSTDIGVVLKYLDVGTIVAGQKSDIYKVWLKNTTGYDVKNVRLFVDQRELDGETVFAELSYDSPTPTFNPEQELLFPTTLRYTESISFFVRLNTTLDALEGGLFDIVAEADPI